MYLKSIEVQGFKSFANKITFEFHDGITAIVGPNGSGKSNVADAVRWVLGEQSAKSLRGARMEDVIFSGTELRRPLGYAYVAITLDNGDHKLPVDYEEVTVARRVYRSGESEYRLNGTSCRLRDVQDLFLDTGIGKEGYSIIGQGQIDKILSGKPEDRRELFDEAAGITKFKKRKNLAEKNLEAERANLFRISDILSELEKQIAPLEKQSATAREYLRLKEELKNYETASFVEEYDRSRAERLELEENLKNALAQMEGTSRSYEGIKAEYERLEKELEEKNQAVEACANLISDTKLKKEKLEGSIQVGKEQILAARQNDGHFRERMEAARAGLAEKKEEYTACSGQKEEINGKLDELDERRTKEAAIYEKTNGQIRELEERAEEARKELYSIGTRNTERRTNIEHQENALEQARIRRLQFNQRLLKSKSEESFWEESKEKHEAAGAQLSSEMKALKDTLAAAKETTKQAEEKASETTHKLETAGQEAMRERSRLDSVRNMAERYEGYGASIRRVMEQKEKNSGVIGVVADILAVRHGYETAVETALGGSIQNIVTDSEETAKRMIRFLKQNKYGRATFLPLTAMRGRADAKQEMIRLKQEEGVIGPASSLVETDERFSGLVEHLLGRIAVVAHIDHAIALAKKHHHSLRIVTLDGEQLSPGGAMSGGAFRNGSNLLGRKRELEELEKSAERLERQREVLRRQAEEQTESLRRQRAAAERQKEKLQELILSYNTVCLEAKQDGVRLEEVRAGSAELTLEGTQLERQIQQLQEELARLKQELQESSGAQELGQGEIAEYMEAAGKLREENARRNETLSAWKLEFASLEQRSQFILENRKRLRAEMERLEEELSALNHSREEASLHVEEKERRIAEEKREAQEAAETILSAQRRREELTAARARMTESHKNFFSRREELSAEISRLDKEIFRLNAQKDKISEQMEAQVRYMWEEYELTYSAARAKLKPEAERLYEKFLVKPQDGSASGRRDAGSASDQWENAVAESAAGEESAVSAGTLSASARKKRIAETRGRIRALGDVNVNAIEDYRNISERLLLLSTQKDDVVKAEEVLLGVIADLDTEMRRQFQEKFGEIRHRFDQVFKELFGGGKGTLELMEDEDILEAGIRIIAQPPGKKLQNMMQLSGGEKALTAISLLFAIQNLKPSPFCLLDEIEAALDDSNVVRFAQYLHKLTKNTQFIVITHRRGTMNAADVLYGITMQEKGVSTLVSVNLIEDKLDK